MKNIPIKPEHRAELKYLADEIFHLERMGASEEEKALALNALARRQAELYPEVKGHRTSFSEDMTQIHLMTLREFAAAVLQAAKRDGQTPYCAFMQAENSYRVLGPKKPISGPK